MPRTADHPTHNPSWSAVQRLSQRPTAYVLQPLQRTQVPIAAAAPSSGAGKTRGQHGSIPHSGSIPTTRLDPALWLDPDNTARSRGSEVAVAEPLSLSWERPLVRPSRLPGPLQGLFERGAALRMLVVTLRRGNLSSGMSHYVPLRSGPLDTSDEPAGKGTSESGAAHDLDVPLKHC